jgi:hypothetical protein
MYFLVYLCIYVLFPFKKKFQAHFELLCLYDFVDVIMFCFYFDMNFHFNQTYLVYVLFFTILY